MSLYYEISDQIARNFLNGKYASSYEFKKLSERIEKALYSMPYSNEKNSWEVITDVLNHEKDPNKRNQIIREVSDAFRDAINEIVEEKSFWNLEFPAFYEILDRAFNIIAMAFGYESHGMMFKGIVRLKGDLLTAKESKEHSIDTNKINLRSIREKFLPVLGAPNRLFPKGIIEEDATLMEALKESNDADTKIDAVKAYIKKTPNSFNTFLFKNIGKASNVYIKSLLSDIKQENIDYNFRIKAIKSGSLDLVKHVFKDYKSNPKEKSELLRITMNEHFFNKDIADYLLEAKIFDSEDIKNISLKLISSISITEREPLDWLIKNKWSPKNPVNFHDVCDMFWLGYDDIDEGNTNQTQVGILKTLFDNGLIDKDNKKHNYALDLFAISHSWVQRKLPKFIMEEYNELAVQKIRLNSIKVNYDHPNNSYQDLDFYFAEREIIRVVTETIDNKDHKFLQQLFDCGLSANLGKRITNQINKPGFEEVKKVVEAQQEIEGKLKSYAEAFTKNIIGNKFANPYIRAEIKGQIYNYLVDMNCGRVSDSSQAEIKKMLAQDPKTKANEFVQKFNIKVVEHKDTTSLFYDIISNITNLFSLGDINKGRVKSISFVEKLASESKATGNAKAQ